MNLFETPSREASASRRDAVTFSELRPQDVVKVAAMPRVLARVVGLALRYKMRMAFASAATLGTAAIGLLLPHLLGGAVERAHLLVGRSLSIAEVSQELGVSATLILAASLLRGLLRMVAGYQGEAVGQSVGYELRLAFFDKLQRLGFNFHNHIHSGDLITRGMLDLEGVRGFIGEGLQRLLLVVLLVGVGVSRLYSIDPLLATLALSFVPAVTWQAAHTGFRLRVTWTRLQEKMALLTRVMEENLQGARVVRAFAAEAFELLRFDRAADAAMRVAAYRVRLRASSIIGMQTAFYMAIAAVLWVGGGRVASNRMSIGDLTEILAFMTILQQPVRQIIMIINSAARATSSGQRLFEILDRAPEIRDRLGAEPLVSRRGVLRFESVDFAYPGSTELVLKNISFDITPGKTLGIVGAPGSGKSTLAHLIPRFYDVTAGRITLDSRDIRDLTLDSLRGAVALVAQETFLFDIAASANIAYAWPDADEAAIAAAAATAHIHDHLASLSHGYMTPVGERGVTLSGGQRQRLSIARGVLADPVVLIFDDSLSAVDTGTEAALRAKLAGVARKCATIIIAHRLSGIRHADEIIVLANGRIVERGGHASLLARNGHYAALHRLQASQTEDQSLRKARA